MERENEELKKEIKNLKSELEASLRREDMLLHRSYGLGYIKQKLKNTSIGKVAANPNSISGKVIRLPRTTYRIITHPAIVKDIRNKKTKKNDKIYKGELEDILVPIKFFVGVNNPRRVNLVLPKLEEDMLKIGVELANRENLELRVVTYSEGVDPMTYAGLVKEKKIPKAKQISFYSSVDQMKKTDVFELEIGENDIFLMKAWEEYEKTGTNK